jgi:hypothetical protein
MQDISRAVIAGALILGSLAGGAHAAAAPAALKLQSAAQSRIEPVHYRCVVRRCGPYRCFWVNRCRGRWWW